MSILKKLVPRFLIPALLTPCHMPLLWPGDRSHSLFGFSTLTNFLKILCSFVTGDYDNEMIVIKKQNKTIWYHYLLYELYQLNVDV